MQFLDNIKDVLQSGKEKAIIDSVMAMFGTQIKAIKPENTIAEFIDANAPALFMPSKDHQGEFDAMAGIVAKLLVAEANGNPVYAYGKIKGFMLAFQTWYGKNVNVTKIVPSSVDTEAGD